VCNKVVVADVINAGAIYTPCAPNTPADQRVVVDRDLVTNDSWHSSAELVDRIRDLVPTLNYKRQQEIATPRQSST
jgi:hypothetical protein